jgi:hypothetical protein
MNIELGASYYFGYDADSDEADWEKFDTKSKVGTSSQAFSKVASFKSGSMMSDPMINYDSVNKRITFNK